VTVAASLAAHPLAAIPSPSQGVWQLGPIPIRAYALCIVLGIVAACVITEVRLRHRGAPRYAVLDIAVWAVPLGIVGARIYHVITSPEKYFGAGGSAIEALYIWKGGLGIWGAVAGGAVGAWIGARRLGIPFAMVADSIAPGLPVAQAIGRWGNWFNNELYGQPTSLPWGLRVYNWDTTTGKAVTDTFGHPDARVGLYHPTFLYESLWDIGVAILVWQLDKRHRFGRGRAFALYVMAYTVGRFWIEALRSDEAHVFLGMRINDWVSIVVFLGALIYFVRVRGPQEQVTVADDGTVRLVAGEGLVPEIGGESADASESAEALASSEGSTEEPQESAEPPEPEPAETGPAEVAPAEAGPAEVAPAEAASTEVAPADVAATGESDGVDRAEVPDAEADADRDPEAVESAKTGGSQPSNP
jgi:prolipoprotein diacylglyceryl transferase